jgi:nucleoid-associated protein YgaU
VADRGTLERLTIKAYEAADYSGSPVATFEAYVNPNEITLAYEIEYDAAQGAGTTGSRMNFKAMKPGDLSLTFFIDGTGANGRPIDVQERVEQFQTATGYNGNSDDQTRVALAQDESPDLTHVRLIKDGDTLPALCHAIYGDPLRYLQVASVNGLDDFRRLEAGTRLVFPPLER